MNEFEDLARSWHQRDTTPEEALRALRLVRRRLRLRRLMLTGVLGAAWVMLLVPVLLGYEGGSGIAQVLRLGCALIFPLWVISLARQLFQPAPAATEEDLFDAELRAQEALLRGVRIPILQLALSAGAAVAAHAWVARGVFGFAEPSAVAGGLLFWLVLVAAAWMFTWRLLRRSSDSVAVLSAAVGRDSTVGRRSARRIVLGCAIASFFGIAAFGFWPLTYIPASREWETHLEEFWGDRPPAATLIAHRIERLDRRFQAEATDEEVAAVRQELSEPAQRYLRAIRATRAGVRLDIESERLAWVLAAEAALVARRIGPTQLAEHLLAGSPESACLQLDVPERFGWLLAHDAPDSELDCLLTSLADAESQLQPLTPGASGR